MTFSDLLDNAWAIFLAVGFVLMFLGYRMGQVKTSTGVTVALERMNLRLIWAGVAVLVAGAFYGLILGIVRGSVFGIVSSLLQVAVYAYVVVTIVRAQRRLRVGGAGE